MRNILLFILFAGLTFCSYAENKVVRYEYWFDYADATRTLVNVTPNSDLNMTTSIPVGQLNVGLHNFEIRFQDDSGKWSSVTNNYFVIPPRTSNRHNHIVKYEYWFDTNYGNRTAQTVSDNDSLILASSINAGGLSNGLHNLLFRFQDNTGSWSSVTSNYFYRRPTVSYQVCKYEYWFDTDYANKVTLNVAPNDSITLISSLSLNTLSNSLHTFHIRFSDNAGKWSSTDNEYVTKVVTGINNQTIRFIKIYPNPVTDYFQIDGFERKGTIQIIDLKGRLVLNRQLLTAEKVNIESLSIGTYTVKLLAPEGVMEWKIIKK